MAENTSNPAGKDTFGSSNNDPYKPKGKGKKAYHRLFAVNKNIGQMNHPVMQASKKLKDIIVDTSNTFKCPKEESNTNETREDCKKSKKKRTMLENMPERIEFEFNCLKFYIDFTLVPSEHNDISDIEGVIVYGTSRTLCFSDCISPRNGKWECKSCQRVVRCDMREDKPLIQFTVTQHGMIQSIDKIEDQWWIEDKTDPEDRSDLIELHYRALDLIWKQALEWSNENILP